MRRTEFVSDLGVGLVGSVVGTRVMEPVTVKLEEWTSPEDKQREKAVSPGSPYALAVDRFCDLAAIRLNDDQKKQLSAVLPYAAAMGAGPTYRFLHGTLRLGPWASGVGAGLLLFAGLDEGLLPKLGLAAPDSAYPQATHLRGLLGHVALGLTLAAMGAAFDALEGSSRASLDLAGIEEPLAGAAFKGLIAGLIGTAAIGVAMQRTPAIMEQLAHAGLAPESVSKDGHGEPAPAKLADKVAGKVFDTPLEGAAKQRAAQAIHWGYGAAWGMLYGLLQSRLRLPHTLHGALLGGLVGGVASTVVPALELSPSPKEQPVAKRAVQFLQHLLYGEVTAVTYRLLSGR
jgi:hypothetical protein